LKSQAHQTICRKSVSCKVGRILGCGAQSLRFGLGADSQHQAVRPKAVLHTVRLAMLTTSVNCSPWTVLDPSPKESENVLERSYAVELASGSYCLCPEQFEPQLREGKKRSLLPVSKSTVSCRGLVSGNGFESSYRKVIPVKDTGGVPTDMFPNHS
jgi:hypothetical protein